MSLYSPATTCNNVNAFDSHAREWITGQAAQLWRLDLCELLISFPVQITFLQKCSWLWRTPYPRHHCGRWHWPRGSHDLNSVLVISLVKCLNSLSAPVRARDSWLLWPKNFSCSSYATQGSILRQEEDISMKRAYSWFDKVRSVACVWQAYYTSVQFLARGVISLSVIPSVFSSSSSS